MVPEWLRFAALAVMFLGAGVSDLRTRRVPNRYWFPFAGLAALFLGADLIGGAAGRWPYLAGAAALCGAFWAFWRLGLFGGADAKGLMVVAWLAPWPWEGAAGPVTVPVVDILVDGTLAAPLVPMVLAAWNLARGRWAGWATFLGYPQDIALARGRHVWPMERVRDGAIVRKYWQRMGDDFDAVYDALAAAGRTTVWVTPKLPLMLLLALGLASFWLGNLVLFLVARLTSA